MKKTLRLLLIISLLLAPFHNVDAWSTFRNEDGLSQANTIAAKTPVDTETSGPKWQKKFTTTAGTSLNSSPIITKNHIFIISKNVLYQLDKEGNTLSSLTLTASMNSISHMALDEDKLFIPLADGIMQCVDTKTMTSLWCSEAFGSQSLTTVYVHDEYVYAGTSKGNGSDGVYYCLDKSNGSTIWRFQNTENPCDYYWSGAIAVETGTTESLIFGGDNGLLISHSLTKDVVYDTFDLSSVTGSSGQIRAGITYDATTNACYTTSTNGWLYKIQVNADGCFENIAPVFLGDDVSAGKTINCCSTPTIYNGRIYVCSYYDSSGRISVIDADTMQVIYHVTEPGISDIKSSPLVSTGYATEDNSQTVYVYFSQNVTPGGIYYIEDNENAVSAQIKTLYEPKNNPQFCMSSIAADTDGTLYYSNDSGTLFAVHEGYLDNDVVVATPSPVPTPVPTQSPSPENSETQNGDVTTPQFTDITNTPKDSATKKVNSVRPKKPTKIKFKIKGKGGNKYKVTFSWKRGKNSKKTWIKIPGKKARLVSGKKYTITLKKGSYTIRFRGYRSASSKSSIVKIKFKLK